MPDGLDMRWPREDSSLAKVPAVKVWHLLKQGHIHGTINVDIPLRLFPEEEARLARSGSTQVYISFKLEFMLDTLNTKANTEL
jgi:hypothetical protein